MNTDGMNEITNDGDVIDSREVIARIEWLTEYPEDGADVADGAPSELDTLRALAEQGEHNADDWWHGEVLIRESYFEEYAKELAREVAGIESGPSYDRQHVPFDKITESWPFRHIDWEAAADELRTDYNEVEFDGVTYLIR